MCRSDELLYLFEQPLHLFVQHFSSPFEALQLQVTFEEWEVYLVRSSCTSGQWKVSDCRLCEQVSVFWELDPDRGVWTGLGEHSSGMSA